MVDLSNMSALSDSSDLCASFIFHLDSLFFVRWVSDMSYNTVMTEAKQKFALWLSKDEAEKFDVVYHRAKARDGRTNYSEVMKELMGFPPASGVKPVTTPADRAYLGGIDLPSEGQHGPFVDLAAPSGTDIIEAKREPKKKRFGN